MEKSQEEKQVFYGEFIFGNETFDNDININSIEGLFFALIDVHQLLLKTIDVGSLEYKSLSNIKNCMIFAINNEEAIFDQKSSVEKRLTITINLVPNNNKLALNKKYDGLESDFTTQEIFQIFTLLMRIIKDMYISVYMGNSVQDLINMDKSVLNEIVIDCIYDVLKEFINL